MFLKYLGKQKPCPVLAMGYLQDGPYEEVDEEVYEVSEDDGALLLKENPSMFKVVELLEEDEQAGDKDPATFICPYCDHKPYTQERYLDKHIDSKHPDKLEEFIASKTEKGAE